MLGFNNAACPHIGQPILKIGKPSPYLIESTLAHTKEMVISISALGSKITQLISLRENFSPCQPEYIALSREIADTVKRRIDNQEYLTRLYSELGEMIGVILS